MMGWESRLFERRKRNEEQSERKRYPWLREVFVDGAG